MRHDLPPSRLPTIPASLYGRAMIAPAPDRPVAIAPSLLAMLPLYGGLAVLSGFLGNKQMDLGSFAMELGLLAYIGVVALSSTVAELHGKKLANRLVLFGFMPILLSMALIALVLSLPYSTRMTPERVAGFEVIFAQSPRIMLAGIAAYFVSVFLNVRVFSWLRARRARGRDAARSGGIGGGANGGWIDFRHHCLSRRISDSPDSGWANRRQARVELHCGARVDPVGGCRGAQAG